MKVTLPKDYKRDMTVHQYEIAKKVVEWAKKNEEGKPEEYLQTAIFHILHRETDENGLYDGLDRVLEANAVVESGCKTYDQYFDGSEDMDILIEGYAKTWNGFIHVIARLSDIWQFDGKTDYRDRMYYTFYVEERRKPARG